MSGVSGERLDIKVNEEGIRQKLTEPLSCIKLARLRLISPTLFTLLLLLSSILLEGQNDLQLPKNMFSFSKLNILCILFWMG